MQLAQFGYRIHFGYYSVHYVQLIVSFFLHIDPHSWTGDMCLSFDDGIRLEPLSPAPAFVFHFPYTLQVLQ